MATDFDKFADGSFASYSSSVLKTTVSERDLTPSHLTLEDLLAETQLYLTLQDQEKIRHAYDLANQAHKGAMRRSGEPYIQHPLEVALLLAGMRIDADGIVSALLHDVVEDTHYSLDELRVHFGPAVANIVDGVTKFDALAERSKSDALALTSADSENVPGDVAPPPPPSIVDKRRERTETVRKMLLAMAEDPRVVVLKLADRLHNMRTLSAMSPAQQQNKARETSEIYIPLARRLGMYIVQAEIEDLTFSYLEPEKFARLNRAVEQELKRRQPYIDEVCRILREEMERAGLKAEVLAWQKHLASINRKLNDVPQEISDNELSHIHDLVSFRILVNSDYECYLALGHIHALWRPKDGRIKDFIATPKLNGYQSLHTTVFSVENQLAEIQIRTHEMERTADYGIASYWYLKERVGKDDTSTSSWRISYREMVAWIEQLREWQRSLPQGADEFVEAVKDDIFQEQIFVFTPKGEVKDLPRGSTPLDMAYRIHTDIGDHCAGARIITDMDDSGHLVTRLVPLDYELKGGEIVDIMVNRTVHPTRDWLSFARTAAARNKIRRYLKTYEREINLQLGRERLDLALKTAGAAGVSEHIDELLQRLHSNEDVADTIFKKYATLDDIYVALGREDLHVEDLMEHLLPLLRSRGELLRKGVGTNEHTGNGEDGHYQQKENENASLLKLAQCCCPIPGDAIMGILNPSKGMYVHRVDCRILRRYRDNNPSALVEINWLQIEPETYLTPISIIAHDRSGLLRDVAAVVADAGINMISVASTTNAASQKAVISATLEIAAEGGVIDQIERILRRLRQVRNVVSVERAMSTR